MNSAPALSGVIVCVPNHATSLLTVLHDLSIQTVPLDELVIVLSGTFEEGFEERVLALASSLFVKTNLLLLKSRRILSAGANRNWGLKTSTNDVVVFMDADDRYHPSRNETIRHEFTTSNAALVIHHTYPTDDVSDFNLAPFLNNPAKKCCETLDHSALRKINEIRAPRDRLLELGGGVTSLTCSKQGLSQLRLHHGHIAVNRKRIQRASLAFHQMRFPRNEDSLFVRDVLWANLEIRVIPEALSAYSTATSSSNSYRNCLVYITRELRKWVFLVAIKLIRIVRDYSMWGGAR